MKLYKDDRLKIVDIGLLVFISVPSFVWFVTWITNDNIPIAGIIFEYSMAFLTWGIMRILVKFTQK